MDEPILNLDDVLYEAGKYYAKDVLGHNELTNEAQILIESFVAGAKWWIFECENCEV